MDPHAQAACASGDESTMRRFVYRRNICFGDCDPAGIAFYPNFYRWFDEAVHALMNEIGWDWRTTAKERGWLGLPCAEASARFLRPVTHGQSVRVESRVLRFEPRRVVFGHRVFRDDVLLCEGEEKRFVGVPHPEDPDRVMAIDAPEELQQALTRQP
ncbi:MAG: acyl-CoA thioesterase [Lautropia sp.]|nr:acyl-CoA thioesterase [Lautropia sp.]